VFKSLQKKNLGVRIMLGVIVGMLGIGMLLYLLPGEGTADISSADVVAQVGDQSITTTDIREQLNRMSQNNTIPAALQPLYAQQVLSQLVFQKELQVEAQEMGIKVSDQERADRIRQLIPTAFVGGTFVGNDQYAAQVQERAQMGVPEFEDLVGQSLIEEKFRDLVTDGITVTPSEIEQEFRQRNEKIKLNYVVVKPDDLQAKINPSDADLSAFFEKNKARYSVPERRIVDYALLDLDQLRAHSEIPDNDIQAYYNQHLDDYKIADRAHVAHILFKTVGKTDAESEEIRQKALDVLKKVKAGGNFGDLAKQYSEDTTKDKGGDLGWIMRGQTVPEFEQAAFSLPVGATSDLVKTQYGYHIIKVMERQQARTQTLDEVRPQIAMTLQAARAEQAADSASEQIANDIRSAGKVPLADLAKKYDMTLGESQPLEAKDPIPAVGTSPEIDDTVFRLRVGDESAPIHTDRGYVVLSLKDIQPAHAATLAEAHDMVLSDYRREKAVELAKTDANELENQAKSGQDLDKAAKSMGFSVQMSDLVARGASIPDLGNTSQIQSAFTLPEGQAGPAVFLGTNWVVYKVVQHQQPDMNDLPKQRDEIAQQLLTTKRDMAFEAFHSALDARMKQDGKLHINEDTLKQVSSAPTS
jgi:peptidyl-prolyl cis-trans isomerase D